MRKRGTQCSRCGTVVPSYDAISLGSIEEGYEDVCRQCFNTQTAKLDGLESFQHLNFEPVQILDCEGRTHEFHFRTVRSSEEL